LLQQAIEGTTERKTGCFVVTIGNFKKNHAFSLLKKMNSAIIQLKSSE
jgi:hypothetical protein